MKVKGIGIKTTRDFVKQRFPDQYDIWIESLPNNSKYIYSDFVEIADWYDADVAYYQPITSIVNLFYEKDCKKGGDELGRFSADLALKGIYKVFVLAATPQYLMKRSAKMIQAYYHPTKIEVTSSSKKHVLLKILVFNEITEATEYRLAGWCARALELCGCEKVEYQISSQLSKQDSSTQIDFRWI